jgi:parallel beta-helix repeat protein
MKRAFRVRSLLFTLLGFCLVARGAMAGPATFYVDPNGNDDWSGRLPSVNRNKTDGPLATLPRALEKSRAAHRETPGAEARVVLRGGTYALDRPLFFTPDDSGLTVAAYPGETPVITSEGRLTGWRRSSVNTNLWETRAPNGWRFHELFVTGQRKGRARAPADGFFRCVGGRIKDHPDQLRFKPGDVRESWARDGGVELIVLQAWAQSRNRISAVDAVSNIVSLAGDAFPNNSESDVRYYIENAPEALRPGQWSQNEQTGLVTYWPEAGEDMISANVTAPRLYDLAHWDGEEERPVHDIVFDGLVLAGTDWRLTGGHDMDVQAAVEVEAALQARFAKHCAVVRCRFTRLGGYAVDFGHGCQDDRITGCEMWDLGGGGVRLGDTDANAARAARNIANDVTDNHIHHIGLVHAPAVGVLALLSANDLIAHNEIDHTFYTAVSVGWSWGYAENPCRGNIIEHNLMHDIGQGMLSDMGGVYTLGLQPGTIIRNNVIHDVSVFIYGGWGLYTDEGSSGIMLESNIVYRCESSGFHQHYGESNLLYNNIFALNRDHQLMRTRVEPHLSFTFSNNIVYFSSGTLFGGNWSGDGFAIDHNIYFDTRTGPAHPPLDGALKLEDWRRQGHDLHSLFVDPLFVDPQDGDFRIRRNSPALPFGFHPLDAREAGPRKRYTGRKRI